MASPRARRPAKDLSSTWLLFPMASLLGAASPTAAAPQPEAKRSAEAKAPPEAKEIDRRCTAAAKLDDAHKVGLRVLADVSDAVRPEANDGRGKWVLFSSTDALRRYARESDAPNTQAWTWSAPDGTFIASFYFQSDSGDWSDDVDYCFRVDGTLARSAAIVVNYSDEVDGERVVYYAADGHVIFSTVQSLDEHGKPRADVDLEALDVPPVYQTIKALPFNSRGIPSPPAATQVPVASTSAPSLAATRGAPRPAEGGDLDPAAVARQVRLRLGKLRHCFEQELAKDPHLAGKVVLHWTIDLTGATRNVSVESAPVPMGQVATCTVEVVKQWHFEPAPKEKSVEISFPFVFQTSR